MEYAVIDIGSNTIRLCIYRDENDKFVRLLNTKEVAGLAGYKKDGALTREGIETACEALCTFKDTLSIIKVEQLFVFTTASLRNITNSKEVIAEIEQRTGFTIDLISGELEAKLGFLGASKINKLQSGLLVDIGGGSTELVEYNNGVMSNCISLPIGSLSLYSTFVDGLWSNKKEQKAIEDHIQGMIKDVDFIKNKKFATMLGIGGSIRTIKKMCAKKYGITEQYFEYERLSEILKFVRDTLHNTYRR